MLKTFIRSLSFLQNQERLLPNERDGISVIAFYSPEMCKGVNDDSKEFFNRSANDRTDYIATKKPLAPRRLTDPEVSEFSLNNAAYADRNC